MITPVMNQVPILAGPKMVIARREMPRKISPIFQKIKRVVPPMELLKMPITKMPISKMPEAKRATRSFIKLARAAGKPVILRKSVAPRLMPSLADPSPIRQLQPREVLVAPTTAIPKETWYQKNQMWIVPVGVGVLLLTILGGLGIYGGGRRKRGRR